ncbi:MAG TPA: type II toxin-antitoxin system death-on-curing family toxin [Candidatus Acidoferrum sp.]|nr:type II toxin-antitoxin system death-on-curing family toxin [Candidatus Acidoferrum sp.]
MAAEQDPSPRYIYLTVAEALEMHRQLIDEFGGTHGLRDRGLLEAAIFRPQNGYYDDLIHEAAALMESLGTNHAFLDGNKRICLAATDTFLRINGFFLELETLAAHKFIMESIAKREFRVRQIREWLCADARPLEQH